MATVTAIDIKPAPEAEVTPVGKARAAAQNESASIEPVRAVRRRLPDERLAITHHFSIAGQEGISRSEFTKTVHPVRS